MLVAYIDEFGHDGPFIDKSHAKFHHHPVFGYAGFILPASATREMGAIFKRERNTLFKAEVASSSTPNQYEKKGNEYFSTGSIESFPSHARVFKGLLKQLYRRDGQLFFYGDEKPVGTVKQTGQPSRTTVQNALRETINRICRHADDLSSDVLIIADSITDKTRREIAAQMYAHIYHRSGTHMEMRRAIEVPLHIESKLNSNVQFADWICALTARASDYQLIRDSEFTWAGKQFGEATYGHFTHQSKIRTLEGTTDIHHSALFNTDRVAIPSLPAGSIGAANPALRSYFDRIRSASP